MSGEAIEVAAPRGFNLSARTKAIAAEGKGTWEPIVDEVGDDTGAQVLMFGSNSPQYRAAQAWRRDQMREIGRKLTDDEERTVESGFLARCCGDWKGFIGDDNKPLAFTHDALAECVFKFPPLYRQIDNKVVDTKRFLAKRT